MVSGQLDHLVGGVAGGFISTLMCHPLDLLKVRFAANEGSHARPQYKGYFDAMRSIVTGPQGVRGLYKGVTPNVLGSTVAWGLYFHIYNTVKAEFGVLLATDDLSPTSHMIAGMLSGVAVMAITNPIWVVKTRLCLQYEDQERIYKGTADALVKIFRNEGIKGLYKGFVPAIFGTTHGALQFMAYDYLKEQKFRQLGVSKNTKLTTFDYILYSTMSKIFAVTATFPYQVVRTRLQDHHAQYSGVVDVIRKTYKFEGFYGFYKGLIPSTVRVLPSICITFVVYENVSHWIKSCNYFF